VNQKVILRETGETVYDGSEERGICFLDDGNLYAYDLDGGRCVVVPVSNPGERSEVEKVVGVYEGGAMVVEEDGGFWVILRGKRYQLGQKPVVCAVGRRSFAVWNDEGEAPIVTRLVGSELRRSLSLQLHKKTAFLFDPLAGIWAISDDEVRTGLCFAGTAVYVNGKVYAPEFNRLSIYRATGPREIVDSVLGFATTFVIDPLDRRQFFAYFADTKEVYVANESLVVVPYLPHIESFDVSRKYFASIETGAQLFVRRRDGGDAEPVLSSRTVPSGALVFVDDRFVYIHDTPSGVIERIDVLTLSCVRFPGVTAVWSTDQVVLERSDGRAFVRGDIEIDLDGGPPLAIAFSKAKFALWSSLLEIPLLDKLAELDSEAPDEIEMLVDGLESRHLFALDLLRGASDTDEIVRCKDTGELTESLDAVLVHLLAKVLVDIKDDFKRCELVVHLLRRIRKTAANARILRTPLTEFLKISFNPPAELVRPLILELLRLLK
jgi:outer membrane protein assembly factor BamB